MSCSGSKFKLLLVSLIIAGCSSTNVKPIYYKDGSQASSTSCNDASWLECYRNAGVKCQEAGYVVLEKLNSKDYGFWANAESKELLFICRASATN